MHQLANTLTSVNRVLIAGGGIGGLACALACARAGHEVAVFERSASPSEYGAGIQLGPNVMRVLQAWGLEAALRETVVFPERLQVKSAASGASLGELRLGADMRARYGAPYALVHRADLHQLLQQALVQDHGLAVRFGHQITDFQATAQGLSLGFNDASRMEGAFLVGADGAWSTVRRQLLGDGHPLATGQLAYRALLKQSELPVAMRSQQVSVWLGAGLHVVHYPVRQGEWLNVVVIVQGAPVGDLSAWDHGANASDLQSRLFGQCAALRDLIAAISHWRLWSLSAREPMSGAHVHAIGRVALLGDAAHPMLPYLAQGAAMAIEDAQALAEAIRFRQFDTEPEQQLQNYAAMRWQRNARVQRRALRNAHIFHANGPLAWGRDLAMRVVGERLLDMPWLYGHGAG